MTETLTERTYAVATFADIEPSRRHEHRARYAIREHLDIGAFGVNAYVGEQEGATVIGEHDEQGITASGQEELYVVLKGHATFTVSDEEIDAPKGTLVFVRPGTTRTAVANEAPTWVLAVGGVRGQAYQPPVWETFREFWPLYEAKDYEGALRVLEEGLEERPGAGIGLYNLACVENLIGRSDDALKHLKKAIVADERFVEQARGDADFDSVRDDQRFAALVPAA